VAAGVLAVTGADGGCVAADDAPAGALPAFVALAAPAVGAEVAVSALAVPGAFAAGAAVAVAGPGAADAGALAAFAGMAVAVAYALNGAVNVRHAQPSVNAARSIARLALGDGIPKAFESRRIARFD
jgi:hypothetical protein